MDDTKPDIGVNYKFQVKALIIYNFSGIEPSNMTQEDTTAKRQSKINHLII